MRAGAHIGLPARSLCCLVVCRGGPGVVERGGLMDQDMVMRARVMLLSANTRVVRGVAGLWIYRTLTPVEPEVYGSKLAYVLVEACASPLVRDLPERRMALLDEAVEVATALSPANPFRDKVLAKALTARRREVEGPSVS
jgi:hypothetical protein